jgi:hypothetical protein
MSTLTERDYINQIEAAFKTYLAGKFSADSLVEVRTGYPDLTNRTPLSKVLITIYCESSQVESSGYDEMIEKTPELELRAKVAKSTVCIDVWTSRGDANNPSKTGGRAGVQRYISSTVWELTNNDKDFYSLYPDVDIDDVSHKYTRSPENFDTVDLFQGHIEVLLFFPI